MIFDVEQHEKNKNQFLKAMYELLKQSTSVNPDICDPILWFAGVNSIADRARLSPDDIFGVTSDLGDAMLIEAVPWAPDGEHGQEYKFTPRGIQTARQLLYDESSLAKRRKFVGMVKRKASDGATSILKEAGKWLGGIVIGAVGANYAPVIAEWIKQMLDIK